VPAIVKKIFCTRYAASAPAKLQRGMSATNISRVTKVPMLAGRNPFIATPTAYAVTTGAMLTSSP
jgi:hypothetical protein